MDDDKVTTPEGGENAAGDAGADALGDAGKRALDAERRARREAEKRLADLEAKAKEAADAEKSEVQRLTERVEELQRSAEAATARADRFEVAAERGLTPAQARRLVGASREELEKDAEDMRAELGLDDKSEPKRLPRENLKAGASNPDGEEFDAKALASKVIGSGW